jgi:drug/metabolite transporter (DMT)-like permease
MISSGFLIVVGILMKKLQHLKLEDIGLVAVLAFLEPFMYFLGETNGLKYVSATISAILIALIPLLTPFAAYLFYKEKLNVLNFIGVLISFLGVALVILKKDLSFNASLKGVILMCLAVVSAIGYSLVVVKAVKKYNIFSIIAYQNLFGALYFFPLMLYFDLEQIKTVSFNFGIFRPLLALAILASSLAFMLFTYGIKELGIVKANTISNSIPVFTTIFAYFLLDEKLTIINGLGIIIVLTGLLLSQLKKAFYNWYRILFLKKTNDLKE